jgi:hypothetical protein
LATTNNLSSRISFATSKSQFDYPDFLEIQLKSFQEFFQLETTPDNREHEGLYKVFSENFPITDTRNQFVLEFLDYEGRRIVRHPSPLTILTIKDDEPVTRGRHRVWEKLDLEDELSDCAESLIDAECRCTRNRQLPLRKKLTDLGSRKSMLVD